MDRATRRPQPDADQASVTRNGAGILWDGSPGTRCSAKAATLPTARRVAKVLPTGGLTAVSCWWLGAVGGWAVLLSLG